MVSIYSYLFYLRRYLSFFLMESYQNKVLVYLFLNLLCFLVVDGGDLVLVGVGLDVVGDGLDPGQVKEAYHRLGHRLRVGTKNQPIFFQQPNILRPLKITLSVCIYV